MLTQKRAKVALLLGILATLLAVLPLIIYAEGIAARKKHPVGQVVKLTVGTSRGAFTALSAGAALHGSLAGSPKSEFTTDAGAGSIQQSRPPLHSQGPFNDLLGATYDQETGDLILIGINDPTLPPISDGALTVALRTRYDFLADPRDYWPGVTIEFSRTTPSVMDVIYFGKVRDTRFGYVLFESDRLLKYYGMGYDNSTGVAVPITSTVPGYESELACLSERGYAPPPGRPIQWRKWFSPTLRILATEDDTAIAFDQTQMTLNWAYDSSTTSPVVDQCVQTFVDHFNAHYENFANEQQARNDPVLHELRQLAKITAVAEWLQSREIDGRISGLNSPWLSGVPIPYHETPNTTPRISVSEGSLIQSGGVDFRIPPESYVPDTGPARDLARRALESRPSPQTEAWQFSCNWPLIANMGAEQAGPTQLNCWAIANRSAYDHEHSLQMEGDVRESSQDFRNRTVYHFYDDGVLRVETTLSPVATRATIFYWWAQISPQVVQLADDLALSQLRQRLIFPRLDHLGRGAPTTSTPRDFLYVRLIPAQGAPIIVQTITDEDTEGFWVPSPGFDLTPYIGQQIRLEFMTQVGSPDPTNFLVGAIELNTDVPPATPTPTPTATLIPTLTPTPTPTSIVTATPSPQKSIYLPMIMRNSTDNTLVGKSFYTEGSGTTWREQHDFWQAPNQVDYSVIRTTVRTQEEGILTLPGTPGAMVTEIRSYNGVAKPSMAQAEQ